MTIPLVSRKEGALGRSDGRSQVKGFGGMSWRMGPIGQPLRAGASVIDILGAMFDVITAQAALRECNATGKGQRVSSALFENAAFLMSTHMAGMTATGLEARPMPARCGQRDCIDDHRGCGTTQPLCHCSSTLTG